MNYRSVGPALADPQKDRCRRSLVQATALGVTHILTGATNLPGAGCPTWTRSTVTRSPVSRLKVAQGFGIRPKVIFWMGWPVVEFMIVATMLIEAR